MAIELVYFLVMSELLKEEKAAGTRNAKGFKSIDVCQIMCLLGPVC